MRVSKVVETRAGGEAAEIEFVEAFLFEGGSLTFRGTRKFPDFKGLLPLVDRLASLPRPPTWPRARAEFLEFQRSEGER